MFAEFDKTSGVFGKMFLSYYYRSTSVKSEITIFNSRLRWTELARNSWGNAKIMYTINSKLAKEVYAYAIGNTNVKDQKSIVYGNY